MLGALLSLAVALSPAAALRAAAPHLPWLRLLAGALLVADARRLGLARYATGLGTWSVVWFALGALWPIVTLPWYLTVRERVRAGLTPLRRMPGESDVAAA